MGTKSTIEISRDRAIEIIESFAPIASDEILASIMDVLLDTHDKNCMITDDGKDDNKIFIIMNGPPENIKKLQERARQYLRGPRP